MEDPLLILTMIIAAVSQERTSDHLTDVAASWASQGVSEACLVSVAREAGEALTPANRADMHRRAQALADVVVALRNTAQDNRTKALQAARSAEREWAAGTISESDYVRLTQTSPQHAFDAQLVEARSILPECHFLDGPTAP